MTDLSIPILFGAPRLDGNGKEGKVNEAELNNQRLYDALNNAINARQLIETEQGRYSRQIEEYEAKRAAYIANNHPPDEIFQIENDIADAHYLRWLVAQQLTRAASIAEERKAYLDQITNPDLQAAEIAKCRNGLDGLLHWWNQWAWTADPRPDAPLMYVPFGLFDCQIELVSFLWDLIYNRRKDGHIDKSRDLGVSWIATTFSAQRWLMAKPDNPFLCTFGSRKEAFVDVVGDADTLLEKIRIGLRLVPGWQLPKGFKFSDHAPTLRIKNPQTNSLIKGESANTNFGRGGRQTVLWFDEHAAWPEGGYAAWTSASETTRSRIAISTPLGKFNKFGQLKEEKNIPHFSLWWYQHPWKTEEAYKIAKRRLSAVELAQEWELDYEGSVAGRILWMFSEPHSVITWSEFVRFFGGQALDETGKPRIPKGWKHRVAHDCGTTDDHPSVITAAAMSPANSRLPGHLFFHSQIFMGEGAHPLILAPLIKDAMRPYIKDGDVEAWLISHEASSEMLTYRDAFGLSFEKWDTELGYTMGYSQSQHYFTPYPGPNPFRPEVDGHPRAFIIVDDDQGQLLKVTQPANVPEFVTDNLLVPSRMNKELVQSIISKTKREWTVAPALNNEGGFKRTREELPRIHIPQAEEGKPVKAQRHFKKFDDAWDTVRAIMASLPSMVSLTAEEKVQQRMRDQFKAQNLGNTLGSEGEQAYSLYYAYQDELAQIRKDVDGEQAPGREGWRGDQIKTIRDLRRR